MGTAPRLQSIANRGDSKGNKSAAAVDLSQDIPIEKLALEPVPVSSRESPQTWPARLVVSCYRVTGMAVLAIILLGLGSYIALVLFYAVNMSWITPQIISPTDEHVLQLNNEIAQATWLREKFNSDRLELQMKLRDAERQNKEAEQYENAFQRSVQQSLTDQAKKFAEQKNVVASYASTAPQILDEQSRFLSQSQSETENLHKAHLIDEEEYLSRKEKFSQARLSGLSLQRDDTELRHASTTLGREVQSYEGLFGSPASAKAPLSYDVLQAKKEYDIAVLDRARTRDLQDALRAESIAVDREIALQDALLSSMRESPYLRAIKNNLVVAFLPYGNSGDVRAGVPIYGCSMGIIWCHRVGQIEEIFAGEVVGKQPLFGKELRGVLIQLHIDEPHWLHKQVLFLSKPPLFF
jgi:F0F1-type ATP synthase membrane subunit b/b'